jgi:hypothetical protein
MSTRHIWTPEDDERLQQAVADCSALFELYTGGEQNKRYGQGNAWDAVAGRMLPGVCVTGSSCAARWRVIEEQRREAESARVVVDADAWAKASAMIEEYEASALERVDDAVARIERRLDAICRVVDALARELGVTETWE